MLRIQRIAVVHKSGTNPVISRSPGNKTSTTIQTKNRFNRRVKRPKVIILRGRAMAFKMGFIAKFTIPNTLPAIIRGLSSPEKSTPETKRAARKIVKMPAII